MSSNKRLVAVVDEAVRTLDDGDYGVLKDSPLLREPRYRVLIDLGVADSEESAEKLLSHFSGIRFRHYSEDTDGTAPYLERGEFVLRREQLSVERAS